MCRKPYTMVEGVGMERRTEEKEEAIRDYSGEESGGKSLGS